MVFIKENWEEAKLLYQLREDITPWWPREEGKEVRSDQWSDWIHTWSQWLLTRLNGENDDGHPAMLILLGMIGVIPEKIWPAKRCLEQGFDTELFPRRAADGLVVKGDRTETASPVEEGEDEARTPRVAPPPVASPQRSQAQTSNADPQALG